MKRIEVTGITPATPGSDFAARRCYSVYLGNRRTVTFTSSRLARAFIADTNRFLNDRLRDLNYLLGQAYVDYRAAWPLLHNGQTPVLQDTEVRLRGYLAAADGALDRAVRNTRGPNGIHFAWRALEAGAGALQTFGDVLAELYRYKTQGVQQHQVRMRGRLAREVNEALRDYAMDLTGEPADATR